MSINIQNLNGIQLEPPQEINHLVPKNQNNINITFKNLNYIVKIQEKNKITGKKECTLYA